MRDAPGVPVRPVTTELIKEFIQWTHDVSMFHSSPEGAAFACELRAVFALALNSIRPKWPAGCYDPVSCGGHKACMYINCRHEMSETLAEDIAATGVSTPD